jgi:flagellar biosynthesis/type III secretory pathway protein FliH
MEEERERKRLEEEERARRQAASSFEETTQRDLEALAIAVARQLVQREVTADPALVATWITRAIALLPHDLTIEIRVHPAELEAMAPVRDTLPTDTVPVCSLASASGTTFSRPATSTTVKPRPRSAAR